MSEKLSPQEYADRADPANEASRNEAWGVDPKEFANGSDYLANRPDVPEHDDYEERLREGDYSNETLEQLAQRVAAARAEGDKTRALDAEEAFFAKFAAYSEKYGWEKTVDGVASDVDNRELSDESKTARIEAIIDGDAGNDIIQRRLDHYTGIMYGVDSEVGSHENEHDDPAAEKTLADKTTPAPEVDMPDAETDFKDLTDEQKAVIVHDVEGSIRNLDRVEYDKKLSKFRDELIRDGGMKKEEAEEVIKQASKNINGYEPAFNEGRPFTAQSPADANPTQTIPSQENGGQDEELTFEQHVARFNEIVASGDDEQLRKLYEDAYRNKKAKGSFEEFRARLDSFDDSQKGTLMREALRNQQAGSQDTPGRLGRLANRLTGARAGRLGDANERVKGMWGSAKERWANMDNKRAKLAKAAAGVSLLAAGIWLLKDHSSAMAVHGIMTSTPSVPGVKETAASIATDGPGLNVGPMGAAGREIHSAFDAGSFSYPWDWAKEAVGADNAQNWLHELSDKAAAAGHQVEWHGSSANQWVAIDGNSKSADVITTLRQFAK